MMSNVNCSKTVNGTDFTFAKHVPRDSLDMTPYKISYKGRGHWGPVSGSNKFSNEI